MSNFGKLLNKGRHRQIIKERPSRWGRCEQCDERAKLFPIYDDKKQEWLVCDVCANLLVDEDKI